jgi:ABC-2 type transport system permease protein
MTTLLRAARTSPTSSTTADAGPPTYRDRFVLSWRLIRRGAMFMWLTLAAYMTVEVLSFRSAYPDVASRQKLLELSDSTAVRMLQAVPGAADTAGGFAVWDGGWMVLVIVAVWVVLTITRLTRGEEDTGRAELVLSRPVTPSLAAGCDAAGGGRRSSGQLLARGVVRWRWLSVTAFYAYLAAAVLVLVSAAGLWAVTLVVLGYLLDTFGTLLEWPAPVLALSPFHHLSRLPGAPMGTGPVLVMTAAGLVAAAVGVVAFARRDLRGA